MTDRNFFHLLENNRSQGRYVCVGLDPDLERLPKHIGGRTDGERVLTFCKEIVDATAHVAGCYKPQKSFFEDLGGEGFEVQRELVRHINYVAPHAATISDAKILDIGNTNKGYARAVFGRLGFDAVTAHNYLGCEAAAPLLADRNKGLIVLCRTSNDGAGEFQDAEVTLTKKMAEDLLLARLDKGGDRIEARMPFYKYVAHRVASRHWNYNQNCCVVAGATSPEELGEIRRIVGWMEVLVPGIGAQSKTGNLEADIRAVCEKGCGPKFNLIINSARDIIFASEGEDFAAAAARRAELTNHLIAKYANG